MTKRLNSFLALVLLAASFCALYGMVHNMGLNGQIAQTRNDIAIEQGKTRKQQAEYDQYTAELPIAKAEFEQLEPQAKAATGLIDSLKAERKALRKQIETDTKALGEIELIDNTALEQQAAELTKQVDDLQKQLDALRGITQ